MCVCVCEREREMARVCCRLINETGRNCKLQLELNILVAYRYTISYNRLYKLYDIDLMHTIKRIDLTVLLSVKKNNKF